MTSYAPGQENLQENSKTENMTHFAVRYRFIDRDTGQTGEGNALVKLDGNQDFDPDNPEQRDTPEAHIADAIACEFPQHKPERLVVLLTSCTANEEPL